MIKLSVPSIGDAECQAVERILRSGQLVHGKECELFEEELARYLGCKEAVVVASGTAALHLALTALGIGPGDAVLVPDFTFPATANVVELVGARPVFVDVDLSTYNITKETLQSAMSEWTGPEKIKAVMPVHEFGCPVDMTAVMHFAKCNDLVVIEDAACALGTVHNGQKVGAFGNAGCFSFHPRKAITTGEGGAIVTDDTALATQMRLLRNHGIQRRGGVMNFVLPGFNYRLTNFQAALGRVQLVKFDDWLKVRYGLQVIYRTELADTNLLIPADVSGHTWQTFMVVLPEGLNRADIIMQLKEKDIETNLGAQGIHCLQYYQQTYPEMCWKQQGNNAERLYTHGLALPLCQNHSAEHINYVSSELRCLIS